MPLEMEQFRRRYDEILQRVGEVPESRTPGISTGLDELRGLLSEFVVSGEELYYKIEELIAEREALDRERNQYRELFESLPDAHIVTDMVCDIRLANRAAASLLQVRPNTLMSQSLLHFLAESDRSVVQERIAELMQRDPPVAQSWALMIRPRQEDSFAAILTVAPNASEPSLHWVLREATLPQPPL